MSSPLTRLVKMFFGWAELYSRYWNLFVSLKNGLISRIPEVSCLGPLYMVKSRKSILVVELSYVNFIVGWAWLRYFVKCSSSVGGPGQIHIISSMYLRHIRGFIG